MIPTYRIAVRKGDRFVLKDWYVFETRDSAKEAMEVLSQGKPIRDFCIMQAVWITENGGGIIGWVFVE